MLISALTIAAATAAGLTSGAYLAVTTMVLPALDRGDHTTASAAMQAVNEQAARAPFMALFFGGAAAAAAVLAARVATARSPLALVGAGLALASFVVTVTVNVPLNNALARAFRDEGWPPFARRGAGRTCSGRPLSAAGAASLSGGGCTDRRAVLPALAGCYRFRA